MERLEDMSFWKDEGFRAAANQMAIDEALFNESIRSERCLIRFYHWSDSAKTVGYFHRAGETKGGEATFTRRYTGGGVVEHGEDITFALCLPSHSPLAKVAGEQRYLWIHRQCESALRKNGEQVNLISNPETTGSASCFEAPVAHDLLAADTGIKIGGGAQRRSKGAIIHQGSLRVRKELRSPGAPWIDDLLAFLSRKASPLSPEEINQIESKGAELYRSRYSLSEWNYRR